MIDRLAFGPDTRARIAEAVAAMLAKINIKVDLQTMPKAQYWQRFDERAAEVRDIGIRRAVTGATFFVIIGLVSAVGTAQPAKSCLVVGPCERK